MFNDFHDQAEIDAFLAEKGDHFGRLAYVETIPAIINDDGLEIQPEQTINHEATVSYEVIDVTNEINSMNKLKQRLGNQEFGAKLLADIAEINSSKNYTAIQFSQLMQDQDLATIERLIWSGSLILAKTMIENYSGSWYSESEKTLIINKINNYLGV